MRNSAALAAVVFLAAFPAARADFLVPEPPAGAQTEFAWWDVFSDPFTDFHLPSEGELADSFPNDEGNPPTHPASTNFEAVLIQNGPDAGTVISSSGGIYGNSGLATEFLIFDQPSFEADSVLLQIRTIGTLPDLESALLYYRETENGVVKAAGAPTGTGFLQERGNVFAMWEWDLSELQVFDYFVVFASRENSMSLQEVQLDTFDQPTNHLGIALHIQTTSLLVTVGEVEHHLIGETEPRATYQLGDQVLLHPVSVPVYDHVFVGWNGDLSGTEIPATLTITESPNVTAVFAPRGYLVWTYNQITPFLLDPPFSERSAIDADPDGDGFTNLLEYALGGQPEVSDASDIRPRMEISTTGEPTFTYRRQMAAADLIYRVMVSEDFINWHYNGDGSGVTWTEELPDPAFNGDGTETVAVRSVADVFPSNDRLFFRLEVIHQSES